MKSLTVALLLGEASALRMNSQWTIGLDGDEDLGEEIIIGGEPFRFQQKDTMMAQIKAQSPEDFIVKPREAIPKKQWEEGNMGKASERVSILEPVIAKTHTTFYDKNNGVWRHEPMIMAEKVKKSKLDPISPVDYDPWVYEYSKENMDTHVMWHDREKGGDAPTQDPRYHHAFPEDEYATFAQGEPEKVHVLQPMWYKNKADTNKPNKRTTFYDKENGMWRQPQPIASFAQVREDEDGAAAKAEKEENMAAAKEQTDAAEMEEKMNIVDTSEKTSIIEPMAYENRYNYYLPYMRTTYYGQKN